MRRSFHSGKARPACGIGIGGSAVGDYEYYRIAVDFGRCNGSPLSAGETKIVLRVIQTTSINCPPHSFHIDLVSTATTTSAEDGL